MTTGVPKWAAASARAVKRFDDDGFFSRSGGGLGVRLDPAPSSSSSPPLNAPAPPKPMRALKEASSSALLRARARRSRNMEPMNARLATPKRLDSKAFDEDLERGAAARA